MNLAREDHNLQNLNPQVNYNRVHEMTTDALDANCVQRIIKESWKLGLTNLDY